VPGLYLTGADICTAGVGGAVMGGVLSASVLTRRNLLGAILSDRGKRPREAILSPRSGAAQAAGGV
jgi:hypothetical protein